MTTVRMSVATSGWIFSAPTLANTAVRAAKHADNSAQASHVDTNWFSLCPICFIVCEVSEPAQGWRKALESRAKPCPFRLPIHGPDDLRTRTPRAAESEASADRTPDRLVRRGYSDGRLGCFAAACRENYGAGSGRCCNRT